MQVTNEEIVLQIQQGIDEKENLGKLYQQNLPLINRIITPYVDESNGWERDDLLQEAYFALVTAVRKWDDSQECLFMTYAVWCVKGHIQRYIEKFGRVRRIPSFMISRISQYRKYVAECMNESGVKPKKQQVMHHLDISSGQYDLMMKTIAESKTLSLEQKLTDDEDSGLLGDMVSDATNVEDIFIDKFMKSELWKQVDQLPKEQSEIMHMKFEQEMTLENIGNVLKYGENLIKLEQKKAYYALRGNTVIKQLAPMYGYDSGAAYHDSFGGFKIHQSSQVENIAIKRVEFDERKKKAEQLMNEILEIM